MRSAIDTYQQSLRHTDLYTQSVTRGEHNVIEIKEKDTLGGAQTAVRIRNATQQRLCQSRRKKTVGTRNMPVNNAGALNRKGILRSRKLGRNSWSTTRQRVRSRTPGGRQSWCKVCQITTWQLCRQQHRYQGQWTKRTTFKDNPALRVDVITRT